LHDVQKETAFPVCAVDSAESNRRVACNIHQSERDGRKEFLTISKDLRILAGRYREETTMSPIKALRIFVVDDEQIIAATVATILQMSGFSATAFTNPFEALNCAGSESPDLLISDVMMPEMSGVDLALQMKETCPNCKVLLFSGQAATVDLLWNARNLGHDFRLLLKPVHPTDLLSQVQNTLQQRTSPIEARQGLSA
jgi:CheY-like chemotaxis protein